MSSKLTCVRVKKLTVKREQVPVRPLYETEKNARATLLLGGSGSNKAYLALASIHAEKGDYRAEAQDRRLTSNSNRPIQTN